MHSHPKTFDEAVALLRSAPKGVDRHYYGLKKGFEARELPEYGLGLFVVEIATGMVCEFKGRWAPDGDLVLCENCFEDGT